MQTTPLAGITTCLKNTSAFDDWHQVPKPGFYLNPAKAKGQHYKLHEKMCHHLKDRNSPRTNSNTKFAADTCQVLLDMAKANSKIVGSCHYCTKSYPVEVKEKINSNKIISW